MQGFVSKGKDSRAKELKNLSPKNFLTCEDGRRTADAEVTVEPVVVPAPPTIAPVQAQDVAVATRTAQNGSVEENVTGVAVDLLLPALEDQRLVVPESPKHLGIEPDVAHLLQALVLLFAFNTVLALLERGFELDFRQVEFGESERTLVLVFDAFETISINWPFPDSPILSDEARVEGLGTVDLNEAGSFDDLGVVFQESGEPFPAFFGRKFYERLEIGIDLAPRRVHRK